MSDAPEWKLERAHRVPSATTCPVTQPNIVAQTGNSQNNLVPILSPSPITPVSNTTWSPLSVEDGTAVGKKSGLVAVRKLYCNLSIMILGQVYLPHPNMFVNVRPSVYP